MTTHLSGLRVAAFSDHCGWVLERYGSRASIVPGSTPRQLNDSRLATRLELHRHHVQRPRPHLTNHEWQIDSGILRWDDTRPRPLRPTRTRWLAIGISRYPSRLSGNKAGDVAQATFAHFH